MKELETAIFARQPRVARSPAAKVRNRSYSEKTQIRRAPPSDCSVPSVEMQANRGYNASGSVAGMEEGGFIKSRKTDRTPSMKRGRVTSLPHRLEKKKVPANTGDKNEAEKRSSKRRREDLESSLGLTLDDATEGPARMETKITNILDSMNKEIGIVAEAAKGRNTRRKIKDATGKLEGLIAQRMAVEVFSALQSTGRRPNERSSDIAMLESEKIDKFERSNSELRAQNRALREEMIVKGKLVQPVNNMKEDKFMADGSYEHFVKVEGLKWPKNIFKAVVKAASSPLMAEKGTDLVILKKWHQGNAWIEEEFLERYSKLHEVDNKVVAISVTTKLVKGENSGMQNERWICRMATENGDKYIPWILCRN